MRILLTGSTGFIGRQVAPLLAEHEVMRLSRYNLTSVSGFMPEIVIHLAWPGVAGQPRWDDAVQVEGLILTGKLLAACLPTCRRWIGVGSQAETSQLDVAYATRKIQTRHLTDLLCSFHRCSFAWARLYSVYGVGEDPASFLPYLINELLSGRDPALTDQNIPWDFLYVEDAARSIVHLALSAEEGLFEIAYGETIYTQDAARCVRDKINHSATLRFGDRPRRSIEIDGLWPDVTRIRETGWRPRVSFSDGVDRLIRSIKERSAA